MGTKVKLKLPCGGVWALRGKGPEGTPGVGILSDLELDLGRSHRYLSGYNFIKLKEIQGSAPCAPQCKIRKN